MSQSFFLPVREVMTRDPERIEGLATVQQALDRMKARHISSLVVERRDAQDEFGLLLVADVAREVISQSRPLSRTNVYEVATKPAPTVDADMNIKYAIRHMAKLGLSHCVVLQGRDLVGLVTLRDLTLRFVEEAAAAKDKPEKS
jgi:signal-transduction protein with cAMP-binding, CBS, and nucleotidyltransferase domain